MSNYCWKSFQYGAPFWAHKNHLLVHHTLHEPKFFFFLFGPLTKSTNDRRENTTTISKTKKYAEFAFACNFEDSTKSAPFLWRLTRKYRRNSWGMLKKMICKNFRLEAKKTEVEFCERSEGGNSRSVKWVSAANLHQSQLPGNFPQLLQRFLQAGRHSPWNRRIFFPNKNLISHFLLTFSIIFSVADPDPGSCAFLTPGSGIGFFRIPDSKPIF